MSDYEFLRYLHLAIFSAWLLSVAWLLFVILRDKFKKQR